ELEGLRRARREVDELLPLVVLAPTIELALVLDVPAALAVVADRGEELRLRVGGEGPELEIDRLPSSPVAKAVERNTAIRGPVVLTIGDERVVDFERPPRVLIAVGELELGGHRVGLNVDPEWRRKLPFVQLRCRDVQQRVAGAIKRI